MHASDRSARTRRTVTAHIRSLATTTIVAALAVTAEKQAAGAQPVTPSPIEIRTCAIVYEPAADAVAAIGNTVRAGIEITYVNRTSVTIDDVGFRLEGDAEPIAVVDHGNFTPGTVIRRTFWTGAMPISSCRAVAVRFAGSPALTLADAVMQANP